MLDLPQSIDEKRVRAYRLNRTRELLAQFQMHAAVLFDPLNLRYATGCRNMQVWTSHHLSRYVFVPVEGPVVLFDYGGAICKSVLMLLPLCASMQNQESLKITYFR